MVLYAFGSNGSGQLGIENNADQSSPQRCRLDSEPSSSPIKLVAGGSHTLVLYDDETVYIAGSLRDGRSQSESSMGPASIFQKTYMSVSGKKVKLCSAFWDGSVFVGSENEIYTAGLGSKGEQGTGGTSASMSLRMLLDFHPTLPPPKIIDIACGVDHVVVVWEDGTVYGWGNGRKGQLGPPGEIISTPRRFADVGFKVVRAVCGKDFTYLVGDQSSGHHKILGSNKWGVQSQAPALIPKWKDVGASWGSIFVLEESGKISSWGRNDHGQLAPQDLPHVEAVAVGSEHVVALTKDGNVICWGWGEHGNCGSFTDKNGDVKDMWNEVLHNDKNHATKVLGVGAGCATSFFWTEDSSP